MTDSETMSAACVDKDQACGKQSDCTVPLACATDYRCRNLCNSDDECNVLGVTGRACVKDANGVDFCADPNDTDGKVITSKPPSLVDTTKPVPPPANFPGPEGMGGMGGVPGDGGAPGAGTGGTATAGTSNGGSGGSAGKSSAGSGGMSMGGDGAAGESGAGGAAPIECVPGCVQGNACVNGECVPCGAKGQACCDGSGCGANLTCSGAGKCACGGANEPCCAGTSCSGGLSCDTSQPLAPVCACGTAGNKCCPGVGGGPATCGGGTVCAGVRCSCIAELAVASVDGQTALQVLVRRVDSTVWRYDSVGSPTFKQVVGADQQPLVASAVTVALTRDLSAWSIGCAIVGGAVWCFPSTEVTNSTFLGAGLGANETTSSPVQVLKGVGGTALTNVVQISASAGANLPTFCAVTGDGEVWCWGYGGSGQLGRGDTANSSFARPVRADAVDSSKLFTGAAEVQVGLQTSCARKQDGGVWCWGTNTYGQLGVPGTTLPQSYFPVRVQFSGSNAQVTATRLNSGAVTTICSIMQDTSVVCWGFNGSAEAGAPATPNPFWVGPTTVVLANGGNPQLNLIDIAMDRYHSGASDRMCARTADYDVVCWGFGNPYPTPLTDVNSTQVSGIRLPLAGTWDHLGYIDASGKVNVNGAPLAAQPPCTNLLP